MVSDGDWLIGAAEVPRAGSVANDRLARRQWWGRKVLWAALATAIATPLLLLGLIGRTGPTGSGRQVTLDTTASPGRLAATTHLAEWLASDPAPLPGGQLVGWDGAADVPAPPGQDRDDVNRDDLSRDDVNRDDVSRGDTDHLPAPTFRIEIDTFSLVDASGAAFKASVQVAVDPRGGALVLAGPSLVPVVPAATDQWVPAGDPWPGRESIPAGEDVAKAVQRWAEAYASGSSDTLRLTVGDPSADRVYVPLSRVESVTAQVTAALDLDDGPTRAGDQTGDQAGAGPARPRTVAARVALTLHWAGGQGNAPARPEPAAPVVMDVLVQRADTAAPIVVAWGAPGQGPLLRPYQNAVLGDGRAPITPSAPASLGPAALAGAGSHRSGSVGAASPPGS